MSYGFFEKMELIFNLMCFGNGIKIKKLKVLLLLKGCPPDHAGAGKRVQCLYSRLAGVHSGFSWYIVSKTESATRAVIKGPETIHFVPIPKNLRVPIIFGLLFEWLWSIFKVIPGIFKNLDVINVAGTGYCMTPLVLATKFLKIKII